MSQEAPAAPPERVHGARLCRHVRALVGCLQELGLEVSSMREETRRGAVIVRCAPCRRDYDVLLQPPWPVSCGDQY